MRDYAQHALRQRLGCVPQQATLFSGRVRSNLLIANPAASEEQLTQAMSTAQALPFVTELDGGKDHELKRWISRPTPNCGRH